MFVWTSGMPSGIAAVMIAVGLLMMMVFVATVVRALFGGDDVAARASPLYRLADEDERELRWECPRRHCRAGNPSHARYCRMCGRRRS